MPAEAWERTRVVVTATARTEARSPVPAASRHPSGLKSEWHPHRFDGGRDGRRSRVCVVRRVEFPHSLDPVGLGHRGPRSDILERPVAGDTDAVLGLAHPDARTGGHVGLGYTLGIGKCRWSCIRGGRGRRSYRRTATWKLRLQSALSAIFGNRSVRDVVPGFINPRRQPLVSGCFIDFPGINSSQQDADRPNNGHGLFFGKQPGIPVVS